MEHRLFSFDGYTALETCHLNYNEIPKCCFNDVSPTLRRVLFAVASKIIDPDTVQRGTHNSGHGQLALGGLEHSGSHCPGNDGGLQGPWICRGPHTVIEGHASFKFAYPALSPVPGTFPSIIITY